MAAVAIPAGFYLLAWEAHNKARGLLNAGSIFGEGKIEAVIKKQGACQPQ
jgi:hypothetical protein